MLTFFNLTCRFPRLFLPARVYIFNDHRQHRYQDNYDDDNLKVLFYNRDIADEIATENKKAGPKESANNIVENEIPILHCAHPGDKWSERADDGDKPGQNDGLSAMLLIEPLCFFKMLPIQKAALLFKSALTNHAPNPIIDGIP